jgi:CspA family cold shock protein
VVEAPVVEAPAIASPVQVAPAPMAEPDLSAAPAPKEQEGELCRGVVKWFDTYRGYGFIQGTDGRDVFVHQSALNGFGALAEGQAVEYTVQWSHKGLQAVSVARPNAGALRYR